MKQEKNHIKVLSALTIAASDTREDTLISIIIRTLYDQGQIEEKLLAKSIHDIFDFQPYDPELDPLVKKMVEDGRINRITGKLSLSKNEIEDIKKHDTAISDEDKSRFQNFKHFIVEKLELDLDITRIKFLWGVFLEYLYNSFYEYGYEAIKTLHPYIDNGENGNKPFEDIFQLSIKRIREKDESLCEVFKKTVEQFPDFASEKDIEFINDLAQKTLSFTSLGIKPDLALDTIDHNLVDWVLYLDTNVLYSLLNLHSHPENQACIALIKLIQSNKDYIQIKLRYSELTHRELNSKKADFSLLDENLSDSAIRALIRSDNLDDFSKKFYQALLEGRESTLHPSKVVELAQKTLKQDFIEIGRNGKRLESLGEEYIKKCMDDYEIYIINKNRIKEEFCISKKITFHPHYRSERQIRHDISLREILLDSRNTKSGEVLTLNNIKFFAITLDDLLISYDRSKVKDYEDERSYPVFFKPSYLLNKLIKILPIRTVDYKKAFIKALTTKGYFKSVKKSEDILKIVNYLKSKGIDDEKVIYNLITEDLFLDKFRKHSEEQDFDTGIFIESELNREFKQRQEELEKAKQELQISNELRGNTEKRYQLIQAQKTTLESDIKVYKSVLEKLTTRVKDLEKRTNTEKQIDINFESSSEKIEPEKVKGHRPIDALKRDFKSTINEQIEKERDIYLKRWQFRVWWNLFWVVPLVVIGCFLVIPNNYIFIEITNENGEKSNWLSILLGIIAFALNYFFIRLISDRYFNESSKKARKENARISPHLKRKLDEL